MKVLVAASSKEELRYFSSSIYIPLVTGVGLTLAACSATRAIIEEKPDIVLSVGTAGSMNPRFSIGDVVSFEKVLNKDQDLTRFRLPPFCTIRKDGSTLSEVRLLGPGCHTLLSSSSFASEKSAYADAADMEAYSVCYAASAFSIQAASFKLITDIVGEDVRIADYKRVLREGREKLEAEVSRFIQSL